MISEEKLEKLSGWGCDFAAAAERLGGDEELLLACIGMFLADKAFDKFPGCLRRKDYGEAFSCAHDLKGISGNLGLAPFCAGASEIVVNLRASKYHGLEKQFARLLELRESLRRALEGE